MKWLRNQFPLYYNHTCTRKGIFMKLNNKIKHLALGIVTGVALLVVPTVASASTYTVQSGDSLWLISQKFDTTINNIVAENTKLTSSADTIFPNETLQVNSGNTQTAPTYYYTPKTTTPSYSKPNTQQSVSYSNTQSSSSTGSVSGYAQEMASRTGVPASEWEAIINRESGGDPTAQNPSSSAHGLFQQLGETSNDPQTQINDAVKLYHEQGLNAWAETR